ncbi:MAG: hypothetical protein WEA28_01295 [Xanthobacteraceae bacterium]
MKARFRIGGCVGAAIAAIMLGAIAQPATALEISRHEAKDSAEVNAILLKGKGELGDTFDLQIYIASLPKKPNIVVYLNSPGGNLAEGIRLGGFFYQNKIETVVESKTGCTSACALAFLGGRDNGSGKPRRTKFSTAGLGFHSFSREFDKTRSYTADDLKVIVRGTQVQVFAVAEYLRSIGTDLDVVRLMLRAAANQMNYLSNDDAIALNIRVWDEKRDRAVEPELVRDSLDRSHAVSSASHPTASSTTGSASTAAPRPVSKAEGSAKSPS